MTALTFEFEFEIPLIHGQYLLTLNLVGTYHHNAPWRIVSYLLAHYHQVGSLHLLGRQKVKYLFSLFLVAFREKPFLL